MELKESKKKIDYLLINNEISNEVFICLSELVLLDRNIKKEEVNFVKFVEENLSIYIFSSSKVLFDIEILPEEIEVIKKSISMESTALIFLTLESKVLLALDIK